MSSSSKLPMKHPDGVAEPLVGGYVASASLRGKGDLSDWVELIEAVEAPCPVWPRGAPNGETVRVQALKNVKGVNFLRPVSIRYPSSVLGRENGPSTRRNSMPSL